MEKKFRLKEGGIYDFKVIRHILMPPDDEQHIIVEDEFSFRFLLKKKHYPDTEFIDGQKITCRIDKVGCNGKIYLEPENAYYKLGQLYDFEFSGFTEIINSEGVTEKMIILKDRSDKEIVLRYDENFCKITNDHVRCRVERIKKSKLMVSFPGFYDNVSGLEPGKNYKFKIAGITNLINNEEFYELVDEKGNFQYIRKKYYDDYGFEKGSEIICEVVETPRLYFNYLEPVHPHYKKGEIYEFDLISIETDYDIVDRSMTFVMLGDKYGNEFHANCSSIKDIRTKPAKVRCRVENIKMSRLFLDCFESV
jgi:hypothetical protein